MTRLTSTMRWDARLQFRNGFYYASGFVAVISIIILRQLPDDSLSLLMPIFVMGNMSVNTYYFMAGIVLLEKDDGVLEGLVVTPLRRHEYLWSKLLTLAVLTVLENVIIVTAVIGFNYNAPLLCAGIVLMGFFNTLYGFIIVARYDSINSFLIPSVFWTMVLSVPILQYFGLINTPLMYIHPIMASLTLLRGGFNPISTWELIYGFLYSLLWIAATFQVAHRAFYRFIILKQGVRT
ncbi:MAG: ABC transporter permease [Chloroflexi bacterium]|nr:ABC transporter permease [Chloroflexota bacterium]